jgi:hypothetical protein
MLRTCKRFFGVPLLCLLAAGAALAQHMTSDPLFGIQYDPQKVHFEKMPARITNACKELRTRYVAAWSYGHFQTANAEYFLIAGLVQFHDEETGRATSIGPEEDDGLLVELRGSRCRVGVANWSLPEDVARGATPPTVPLAVMSGILWDAFRKFTIAFGGKQRFLQQVKRIKQGALLPLVRQQLAIFERGPS